MTADGPEDAQDRAREGVAHLQSAARELIHAARALLDVAEDMVDDPDAVAQVTGAVGSLGEMVRHAARAAPSTGGPPDPTAGGDDDSGFERITVT